ncbi:hypothetical protein BGP_4265 [Beggiatoa sp. PS]|nr:hypothetical protein BGP_4265 [Beggiatoa sp. PS]
MEITLKKNETFGTQINKKPKNLNIKFKEQIYFNNYYFLILLFSEFYL